MKLAEHVEQIRQLIDQAFRNRLGRMGITATALEPLEKVPEEYHADRNRIESIRETLTAETGSATNAFEKLVEEFTFTFFNRLAALKVMEAHALHPEIVTRRRQHGDRSFAHFLWLEQNPDRRNEEQEGLLRFMEEQLCALADDIPLLSPWHPYHLLPTAIELRGIMDAFNQVETDDQVDNEIWKSDDVLGWLYESYNNYKKAAHKDSKAKTEYNKVSIQSQVYTPSWVVKFLVDNSLGKLYLEMYPESTIKDNYIIANAPATQTRDIKPLTEIRLIDPACGSGNFLLYAFDLLSDLYTDQIDNYEADYDESQIPELIIKHNLHGIDLDDRAVQLAQLGLYIKVKRKKRSAKIEQFNIVSSDFFLSDFKEIKHLFENGEKLKPELEKIVIDLWEDLQQAHKFGSLIRLEEKFSMRLHGLVEQWGEGRLFEEETLVDYGHFRENFFANLQKAVAYNTEKQGITFLNSKTRDAISFLQLLTQKYDVAVANPPYTDSSDFGPNLKTFVDSNYKQPYKFNSNLYAAFIQKCVELTDSEYGKIGLLHPLTFMYISSFKEVRKYLLEKTHINILAELGLGGVFANSNVQADVVAYTIEKNHLEQNTVFLDFKKYKNHTDKPNIFSAVYNNLSTRTKDEHIYALNQSKLKIIEGWPFIYWISDAFREKFKEKVLDDYLSIRVGLKTGNNDRFLRFWWEIKSDTISKNYKNDGHKWVGYAKGGPYNKWHGNLWAVVNWDQNGKEIIDWCNYLNTINDSPAKTPKNLLD
ncbi:MAG: N-6 DNA methylase [Clostridia bacterium]|nr:N-6 DNA methylase [Clostridia bacterium]